MIDPAIWGPLKQELGRWNRCGKRAVLWLRDDDTVEPTGPLDHLLDLAQRHAIPLTLAVIPKETGHALVRRLDRSLGISVAVHGWSHENHAPPGEKKQELGGHRAIDIILDELRAGASHLANLHGDRFVSLLVPPWNRIDPPLLAHLPKIGYTGVSVFGPEKPSPLRSVNTHVDLIDWKSTRGGRDPATLIQEIVARLKHNFDTDGTVGLLTHHLVHDQNAWSFLEQLFDQTSGHPACRWTAISDIFQTRMNFTSPL